MPGLHVSPQGIWAETPGASHLEFAAPVNHFTPTHTDATSQVCDVDADKGAPRKVRTSLIGCSVDLFFPTGATLICRSSQAPFLSWGNVSVGANVPTENLKWVLVSFADQQPPLLFGLSGETAGFEVTGSKGAWKISSPDFGGWLRIWLPFGLESRPASDEAGLEAMMKGVRGFSDVWEAETPTVKSSDIKSNDTSVDATWTFSGPGAFVPQAPLLAPFGGSPLTIGTEYRTLPGEGMDGPRAIVKGDQLSIHFPCLKIRPGRALGLGPSPIEPLASVAEHDLPSIVELANELLLAIADDALLKLSDDTVTRFLTDTPYVLEPTTNQQLPYGADPAGTAMASGQAYLAQCAMVALSSDQPNALFDSVIWRRDWWTWMIWTGETDYSRKATSLAALSGALSQDQNDRFYGATLEAGLDAQRGLEVWRGRHKFPSHPESLVEPLLGIRTGIFALSRLRDTNLDFFHLLQSPLKIGPGPAVELLPNPPQYALKWQSDSTKPASLLLLDLTQDLAVDKVENLGTLEAQKGKDRYRINYQAVTNGTCRATLSFTPALTAIPKQVAPPTF